MSTGKTITEVRQPGNFNEIELDNNINLYITQGNYNQITIEAGENLMKRITTNVSNNCLYIKNQNTCNWVRELQERDKRLFNPDNP